MSAILDAALLGPLSRLHVVTRRCADGAPAGNRIGRRRGSSLEFADHRPYTAGDDLRQLDWKLLARHDQPQLRRHYEEQALPLRIAIDTSASMGFGVPTKLELARTLAAGLAFVGLASGAMVSLHAFADRPAPPLGPLRGRARLHQVLRHLEGLEAGGSSSFPALAQAVSPPGRSGLVVLISDFLFETGLEEGLERIDYARNNAFLLRVWSQEEEAPAAGGDLSLIDAETGQSLGISLLPSVLAAYQRVREAETARLAELARRRGAGLALVRTGEAPRDLLLSTLPAAGLLE